MAARRLALVVVRCQAGRPGRPAGLARPAIHHGRPRGRAHRAGRGGMGRWLSPGRRPRHGWLEPRARALRRPRGGGPRPASDRCAPARPRSRLDASRRRASLRRVGVERADPLPRQQQVGDDDRTTRVPRRDGGAGLGERLHRDHRSGDAARGSRPRPGVPIHHSGARRRGRALLGAHRLRPGAGCAGRDRHQRAA